MGLTYEAPTSVGTQTCIFVRLAGKRVGAIRRDEKGWYYVPKTAASKGDYFKTLEEVRQSLEGE